MSTRASLVVSIIRMSTLTSSMNAMAHAPERGYPLWGVGSAAGVTAETGGICRVEVLIVVVRQSYDAILGL